MLSAQVLIVSDLSHICVRDGALICFSIKDQKTREYFEKVFPEIKKSREDKERLTRWGRFDDYIRSCVHIAVLCGFYTTSLIGRLVGWAPEDLPAATPEPRPNSSRL